MNNETNLNNTAPAPQPENETPETKRCPVCGKPMTMNLRSDDKFVEDEGWHKAAERYNSFIDENKDKNIVYLELGVGGNTPVIIKYPFWQLTAQNKNAS